MKFEDVRQLRELWAQRYTIRAELDELQARVEKLEQERAPRPRGRPRKVEEIADAG